MCWLEPKQRRDSCARPHRGWPWSSKVTSGGGGGQIPACNLRGPLRPCEGDADFCYLHAEDFRVSCDDDNQLRPSLHRLNWRRKYMVSLSTLRTLHCTILLVLAVFLHRLVKYARMDSLSPTLTILFTRAWDLWNLRKLIYRGWRSSSIKKFYYKIEGRFIPIRFH